MKLQFKFTLHFILLVLVTITASFFLINFSVQSQFDRFIEEKNQEWLEISRRNPSITIIPFRSISEKNKAIESPEEKYQKTVSKSLLLAGLMAVFLGIILAYLQSKFLLQKIYRLKSSMHRYMLDGTSKPVFHNRSDEIDDLANIYNHLIKKIEKEEKIRREFFTDMSHELRTPITSIKGYLEGLIDQVFDQDKEKDIYKKALSETNRMARLIKEMTTLAKLETEDAKLDKIATNIKELTQEVVETFITEADSKNIKINILGDIEANLDQNKFKQVIINLLENAIQYGKSDSNIEIEMNNDDQNYYWSIKNESKDINQETADFFFERFYRADKSRQHNNEKPHLGIGLNIVRKIIEQHQGKIEAKVENSQITFKLTIPRL
ncbi:HAMP domain-containing histidine kinase [Candidatus Peregrinibacteria bacterium]|nr:HAMP domain-containing histidine kinase [Candidatus Peregrinibacteria bacterium]